MVLPALNETTWVAIDPGGSRLSPSHIQGTIRDAAGETGVDIQWLATNPIEEGEHRFGFLVASQNELAPLKKLVLEQIASTESSHEHSLIEAVVANTSARFIIFPSEIATFTKHSPTELISRTAIEQVIAIGEEIPMDAAIDTRNYLRPVLYEGKITLFVERLYTGEYAPIERENPHECCGGAHAPY